MCDNKTHFVLSLPASYLLSQLIVYVCIRDTVCVWVRTRSAESDATRVYSSSPDKKPLGHFRAAGRQARLDGGFAERKIKEEKWKDVKWQTPGESLAGGVIKLRQTLLQSLV